MKVIIPLGLFLIICFSGAFVGIAGGVQWGTPACGFLAFCTLGVALYLVLAVCGGFDD